MYKVTATFFSIFLIGISLVSLWAPNGELGMFLVSDGGMAVGRLALAFALIASLFTANIFMKVLLRTGAAVMAAAMVVGLFGAELYLLPIDFFIVAEASVLCMLGSARPVTPAPALGWARAKRATAALAAARDSKATQF